MDNYFCSYLPRDLNLYQTSSCNFNCSFCRRATGKIDEVPDVSPGLVETILYTFPISSCCIAGFGEPLMSEGVFDVVEILNRNGITPSIITNGSLIRKRIEEIKKVNLLYMNVSLNTWDSGKHKEITGTDTFKEVIEGVKLLAGLYKFPIFVSKVLFRHDYLGVPSFLEFVDLLGVDKVLLINSLPYDEKAVEGILTEKDVEIAQMIEKYSACFDGRFPISKPRYLKAVPDHCCNSPWKSIGVDGNGNITGCRRFHGPRNEQGNISDKKVCNNEYILE